jgi:hypothetical protein
MMPAEVPLSRSALIRLQVALLLALSACEDPEPKPNNDVDPDDVGGGVGGGSGDGGADGASDGGDGGAADVGDCVDVNLGDALGEPVHEGNTSGAGDDNAYCEGGGGGGGGIDPIDSGWTGGDSGWSEGGGAPDLVFQWQAPASGTYTIATRGTRFDTTLTVLDGSCEGRVLECDDDGGSELDSRLVVRVTEGDVLLIVFDGFGSGDEGPFQLHITEGGTEPDDSGVVWEETGWGGDDDPPEPAAMFGALLGALGSAAVGLAGLRSRRRRAER